MDQKWEYFEFCGNESIGTKELNEFGKEGWELVGFGVSPRNAYQHSEYIYLFKRPLTGMDL